MKYRLLFVGILLLLTAAGALAFAGKKTEELARAEFSVRNLTCVACTKKIEKALAALPGIAATEVDVAAGRAAVTFAPAQVSAGTIAETISATGYPAGLLRTGTGDAAAAATAGARAAGAGCACCN